MALKKDEIRMSEVEQSVAAREPYRRMLYENELTSI